MVPDTPAYRKGDWFDYSDDFISANEAAGRLRPMLVWARAAVLAEAVGCAALLYLLGRRFFGPDGGAVVAAAWLTTPYVVGFGHFAMIDVPFTLAVLATSVVLARWRDGPTLRRAAAVGLVLGAALASRHTSLVLVVVVVGVMAHARRRLPREAAVHIALAVTTSVLAVWVVYRGLAPTGPSGTVAVRLDDIVASSTGASVVSRLVTALPFPAEWRAGFAYLDLTSVARPSSLLERSWDGGRWWYFPASALVKLPLTLVAAIVAGWALVVRRRLARGTPVEQRSGGTGDVDGPAVGTRPASRSSTRGMTVIVVAPGVALWLALMAQPLNLGLRLALPIVALSLVGLGALVPDRPVAPVEHPSVGGRGHRHRVVAGVALAVLAVGQVASVAGSARCSFAWTSPPWRPAYRWASGADLDIGQAVYELRDWAQAHDHPSVAYNTSRGGSPQISVLGTSVRRRVGHGR